MPIARSFHRAKRNKHGYLLAVCGILLLLAAVLLDGALRPVIQSISVQRAKLYAAELVNRAIQTEMDAWEGQTLTQVERLEDGTVSSIVVNTAAVTKMNAEVVDEIAQQLSGLDYQEVSVPLGTLTGIGLFAGRGPDITLKLLPQGSVATKVQSSFTEAGINQTNHRVSLVVTIQVSAILPPYSSDVEVKLEYILAEAVIVGKAPNYFTQVISEEEKALENGTSFSNSQLLFPES